MNKKEKELEILRSVSSIHTLADLVLIEYQQFLCEKPFSMPVLNQKAKRIKQDAEDIKKHLYILVNVKDKEESEEHMLQMSRLVRLFSTMDVRQLTSYLDKIEELPIIEIENSVNILD